MRFLIGAVVVGLALWSAAAVFATAPAGALATAAGTDQASTVSAAAPAGDAAAKHAKRTACLKVAKAKKLAGADKTSFLKACIAAP